MVYFLFGISDQSGKSVVYIGQAGARKNGEGLLNRLQEHKRNPEKDYWCEAIVLTTTNNSFGPTEISYLENRFCGIATIVKRYEVKNGNNPTLGNVTEEKECELEEFIDYATVIVGTLGHKVFVPLVENNIVSRETPFEEDKQEDIFYLKRKIKKSGKVIDARCKQTNEGFVVLKGSNIEVKSSQSIPTRIKEVKLCANLDSRGILQEDFLFNSPSYAATFVTDSSTNGLTEWKNENGIALKDIENNRD